MGGGPMGGHVAGGPMGGHLACQMVSQKGGPIGVQMGSQMDGQMGGMTLQTPLEQFKATWGIDDKCMEYVESLRPEVQAIVLEKFTHGPGQTNASARCFAFARSIEKSL